MEVRNIDRTIVALDFPGLDETKAFIDSLQEQKPSFVKVGMELFYAAGPQIISYLKEQGLKIFLDLKVHDIPNTAHGAIKSLADLGVDILNVHASGGFIMMQKAREAISGYDTKLIGVTVLTSFNQEALEKDLLINYDFNDLVINLAQRAHEAGLDGVVSSPLEAQKIKEKTSQDFLTVCPGIRFADSAKGDQKRIADPDWALANGCDYIVMGRAITQAEEPQKALARLL